MKILFLHGSGGQPGGAKPTYLASCGHEVINPHLPDESFEHSVTIAKAAVDTHHPEVIVGSSRGGAVAMRIVAPDARLVLVCPAWKHYGLFETTVPRDTRIIHSPDDEVVPFADSLELVKRSELEANALIVTGSDHRLADEVSLAAIEEACSRPSNESNG